MKRILTLAALAVALHVNGQAVLSNGTFFCMGDTYQWTNGLVIGPAAALAGWGTIPSNIINYGTILPVGNGSILLAGRAVNFAAPNLTLVGTTLTADTIAGFGTVIETSTAGPGGPWYRSVGLPEDGYPHSVTIDTSKAQRYFRAYIGEPSKNRKP